LTEIYKQIDVNGDRKLSVSEINQWFCRNRMKTNDQVLIKRWRQIIILCLKVIDKDGDGYVCEKEFPKL